MDTVKTPNFPKYPETGTPKPRTSRSPYKGDGERGRGRETGWNLPSSSKETIMTKTQTIDHLYATIGFAGVDALVAEGIRRRMTVREISRHLNIPQANAGFFAIGHENEFPLQPGERVRLLKDVMGWRGNGTVIEQLHNSVRLRKDGAPKHGDAGIVEAMRHEVELTNMQELLPEGATFNDDGCIAIPCDLSTSGKQIQFYCPHCKDTHRHGAEAGGTGYRSPHCHKSDSPLKACGDYYIYPKAKH